MSLESSPNPQKQEEKSSIQEIKDTISNSPERLKAEYERTNNPWLACFTTDLSVINTYLFLANEEKEISSIDYHKTKCELDLLIKKVGWLQKLFPSIKDGDGKIIDKDGDLPDSIKERLAQDLQNLSIPTSLV